MKMGRKTPNSFNLRNMLKSIATARSESTTKHESKASYNADYIVPDLIDFFCIDINKIRTQIEKQYLHL